MKFVAVSQRVDEHPDRNEKRDALDQQLNDFLISGGYLPIPVPTGLCKVDGDLFKYWIHHVNIHAVVLSGGNDIGACLERDETEKHLLEYAKNHQLPVLGICRGMQMMAVWAGANLKEVSGHVATYHELTGELARKVNSYHNLSVESCPKGFAVLAFSVDGEIEAIENRELSWEGWMWHPERESSFLDVDLHRMKLLFESEF